MCEVRGYPYKVFFTSGKGVRQGDVLSPNLFKIFINDFPNYLSECKDPVNINNNVLQCLMYADDIVLFSTSLEGLHQRLNELNQFCKEWCLDLNVSKTKILIFNKGGKLIKILYISIRIAWNVSNIIGTLGCTFPQVVFSTRYF